MCRNVGVGMMCINEVWDIVAEFEAKLKDVKEENLRLTAEVKKYREALKDIRDRISIVRTHEPHEFDVIKIAKQALSGGGGRRELSSMRTF